MRCGSRPQLQDALVCRVVRLAVLDGANSRLGGNGGRREVGLAGSQVDDVFPRRLAAFCLRGNRDRGRCLQMLEVGGETFDHREMAP